METLLPLLWLRWRLFVNGLRQTSKLLSLFVNVGTSIIMGGLSLGLAVGVFLGIYIPDFDAKEMFGIAGFLLNTLFVVMVMLTIFGPGGASKSQWPLSRLFTFPVRHGQLFAMDFLGSLFETRLLFFYPAFIAWTTARLLKHGLLPALMLAAALMVFVVFTALVIYLTVQLISIIFRRWMNIAFMAALSFLPVLFIVVFEKFKAQGDPDAFKIIAKTVMGLLYGLPGGWVGSVERFMLEGRPAAALGVLAACTLGTTLLGAIGYLIFLKLSLNPGSTSKKSSASNGTKAYGWNFPGLGSATSAMVEKEIKYFYRSTMGRFLLFIPTFITFVVAGPMRLADELPEHPVYGPAMLLLGIGAYLLMCLANPTMNSFIFDGRGVSNFLSAPVTGRKVLMIKNLSAVIYTLVLSLLTLLSVTFIVAPLPLWVWAAYLLLMAGSMIIMAGFGNYISLAFPRHHPHHAFATPMPGLSYLFGLPLWLFASLPMLLFMLFCYLEVSPWILLPAAFFACALSAAFYFLLLQGGEAFWNLRKERLIQALCVTESK